MRVSRRGSQALALGTGVAALLAIATPAMAAPNIIDLQITKTNPTGAATVGTAFTYGITVQNNSASPTQAPAIVTDVLEPGLAFQSASAGCVLTAPSTVTCTIPAGLTTGAPANLAITVVPVTNGPAGGFTNTATVSTTTPDADNNPNNNTSTTTALAVSGTPMATCFGKAATIVAPTPAAGQRSTTIDGTNGDDVIIGTNGNDTIDGEGGNDSICGEGGNDHLYGGSGDDQLSGGRGSDLLDGGAGRNVLRGDRDSVGFPFTASADRRWRRGDRDQDILICQRGIDDCRSGFGDRSGFDGRDGRHGRHGDRDRIIFIPRRDHGDRFGRDGDFRDFSAKKGAPAAKPAAKPVAKPMPKPVTPAVAGTEPVAPKH